MKEVKEMYRRPTTGKKGEKISEYFDPSKHELVVRRGELMAILSQLTAEITMPWYARVWRWLQRYYLKSATAPVVEEDEKK